MQDNMGATALHRASSKGNVRVMVRLLQCNMCSVNIQDKEGNTPLHLACEEERLAAVRLLLEHNASTSMVNKAGKSPLQMTNTSLRHLTHMNEL
ncbi:26S proteasome non-ATPase regulatory subunit 10-like [Penaeus indicus]